jgi:hypothetical protein
MLVAGIAAMSTFHPEASTALQGDHIYEDEAMINKQIFRLLGKGACLCCLLWLPYVHLQGPALQCSGISLYTELR